MKLKAFTIAAMCMLGSTALADTYKCIFTAGGTGGWIGDTLYVKLDEQKGTAFVIHNQTAARSKEWYPAVLDSSDKKRAVVKWEINWIKDRDGQSADLDYRLRLVKTKKQAVVSMIPGNYDNRFSTTGPCQKQT